MHESHAEGIVRLGINWFTYFALNVAFGINEIPGRTGYWTSTVIGISMMNLKMIIKHILTASGAVTYSEDPEWTNLNAKSVRYH